MLKFLRPLTAASALAAAAATVALTGCAGTVSLEPAEDANNPLCAQVTVRLPATLGELERRSTNAQATGAWGDPTAVIVRCGLAVTQPTEQACITVNDVDWVVDDTEAPKYRFTAYGREPGFDVLVDSEQISGTDTLLELSAAVQQLPQVRQCSSTDTELSSNDLNSTDDSVSEDDENSGG